MEVFVADLVGDKGLDLLGIEEVQGTLGDEDDRAGVQTSPRLRRLYNLDLVSAGVVVKTEHPIHGRELLSLRRVQLADLALGRKRGEDGPPNLGRERRRPGLFERFDDVVRIETGEILERGFERRHALGRDGRERSQEG